MGDVTASGVGSGDGAAFEAAAVAALERARGCAGAGDRELIYRTLVDFFGCVAGGTGVPFVAQLRRDVLGIGEASVVCGKGRPGSAHDGALANAAAAHSRDFDDTHWSSTLHPSAVVWGALLATDIPSGSATKLAVAYQEAIVFISELASYVCPAHIRRGWHSTSTMGSLAAAVALSRIRGYGLDRTAHAVGIAGTMMGGLRRNNTSSAKALHAGRAAANAVLASDLAALPGFDGAVSLAAVGDVFGFAAPAAATAITSSTSDLTFKPYPTCSGTHAAIDAAIELAQPTLPERVCVRVPAIVGDETHNGWPTNMASARLSLPFVVAVTLANGDLEEATLIRGLGDESVRALFERIEVEIEEPVENERYCSAATVAATWASATRTVTVDCPRGDPRRPLSTAKLEDKMRRQSARVWSRERQDAILAATASFAGGSATTKLLRLTASADMPARLR